MKEDRKLTVKEVAARLGLSESGVRRLIINKVLPSEKTGYRTQYVRESDLLLAAPSRRPRKGRRWKKE